MFSHAHGYLWTVSALEFGIYVLSYFVGSCLQWTLMLEKFICNKELSYEIAFPMHFLTVAAESVLCILIPVSWSVQPRCILEYTEFVTN
jgi:hypothetical protein